MREISTISHRKRWAFELIYVLDFGRTEIPTINLDDNTAGFDIDAFFLFASTLPSGVWIDVLLATIHGGRKAGSGRRNEWGLDVLDLHVDFPECLFDKFANGVRLPCCEDEILWVGLLKHEPHPLDVVASYEIKD